MENEDHIHVRCPKCNGSVLKITVFKDKTIVECAVDGEMADLAELEKEFRIDLNQKN